MAKAKRAKAIKAWALVRDGKVSKGGGRLWVVPTRADARPRAMPDEIVTRVEIRILPNTDGRRSA